MAVELSKTAALAQLSQEDDDYDDYDEYPGFFYLCAYCNGDQGHDHMDQMCADCFWEYDSLCKRPGRIQWSLIDPKYADRLDEVDRWIQEAVQIRKEFRDKLEVGWERIQREFEAAEAAKAAEPKTLEEMSQKELESSLVELDEVRKEMRRAAQGREFTPEEKAEYEHLDNCAQARVDELTRRGL